MASRLRAALDAALTRVSPSLAAHLKLWRRARDGERPGPGAWDGWAGVDYREHDQLERIRGWNRYADLFSHLRRDRDLNDDLEGGPVRNAWFATPDAEVYAAMIGDLAPRRIVEIGGGFSTRVARRAVDELGLDCRITVVDPAPRTEVAGVADDVIARRIESVELERFPLDAGTLVFVDSSHIAMPGGDVPFVYGRLIPRLSAGAFVHVHDVFLPFEYPSHVRHSLYNEQYLVHALLSGSERYRVLFATHMMSRLHPEEVARAVPGVGGASGGSFWFAVDREP